MNPVFVLKVSSHFKYFETFGYLYRKAIIFIFTGNRCHILLKLCVLTNASLCNYSPFPHDTGTSSASSFRRSSTRIFITVISLSLTKIAFNLILYSVCKFYSECGVAFLVAISSHFLMFFLESYDIALVNTSLIFLFYFF